MSASVDRARLAKMIDHTILRPDATRYEVVNVCEEEIHFGFASVCVNPTWVSLAHGLLGGSGVKVDAVVGFPFGATAVEVKVFEAETDQ